MGANDLPLIVQDNSMVHLGDTSYRDTSESLKGKDYQGYFAGWIGGDVEILLEDRTRIDVVTDEYAIEVKFSHDWAAGIGQALYYAETADKKPGVLLILARRNTHDRYINQSLAVANKYNIRIWLIRDDFKIIRIEDFHDNNEWALYYYK